MPSRQPLPPQLRGGPFATADARAAGVGEGRLRGPDLDRPFHGVRAPVAGPVPASAVGLPPGFPHPGRFPDARAAEEFALLAARCLAYTVILKPGQFFSHLTAARLWKCPLPEGFARNEPLHVTTTRPSRAPEGAGIVGHQIARDRAHVVDRFGFPVSDPAATWLALAPTLGLDDLVAVGDYLVFDPAVLDPHDVRPHTTLAELAGRIAVPRSAGSPAAASALPFVRQGAEARTESLLRLVLVRAGLPEPELAVDVYDRDGRWLGRADMLFREWRVITEYDGEQHRTSSAQYERDEARIEGFNRAGFATVRILKQHLFVQPRIAVERVGRALRDAGWPG